MLADQCHNALLPPDAGEFQNSVLLLGAQRIPMRRQMSAKRSSKSLPTAGFHSTLDPQFLARVASLTLSIACDTGLDQLHPSIGDARYIHCGIKSRNDVIKVTPSRHSLSGLS